MLFTHPVLYKQGILCSLEFSVEAPYPGGNLEGSMMNPITILISVLFYVSFNKWKVTECVDAHMQEVIVTISSLLKFFFKWVKFVKHFESLKVKRITISLCHSAALVHLV